MKDIERLMHMGLGSVEYADDSDLEILCHWADRGIEHITDENREELWQLMFAEAEKYDLTFMERQKYFLHVYKICASKE